MSAKASSKILVAGDVAIDWLQYPIKFASTALSSKQMPPNWTGYANIRMIAKPGGAMLLAEMVRAATGAKVIGPELQGIEGIPADQIIHANASLDAYPASCEKKDEKNLVYRVKAFHGYAGPDDGSARTLQVTGRADGAAMIIFDDAGNGFREDESLWRGILEANPQAPILLKMSRPLMEGKLWQELIGHHCGRLIVLVAASHLREFGVNMSRCLSWERTAQDFVWQMQSNKDLNSLVGCADLVVRFGSDAAIHYTQKGGPTQAALYYDPRMVEDGMEAQCPGGMYGQTCAFTASLADTVLRNGAQALGRAIPGAIVRSRRLYRLGFGRPNARPEWPLDEVFRGADAGGAHIASIPIPLVTGSGDGSSWTILGALARTKLETVAYDTVRLGSHPLLEQVPVAQFGNLTVIDRTEIESYQSIRNLMIEYIADETPERPLSIAVFGPPGAGKSFGVTELAGSIAPGKVKRVEFNVSQFESPGDIVNALHQVRDEVLQGKIPLVFFDEFDSQLGGEKLGWLKYFLMPMQDGKFRQGETIHPIGKAIFVFAGGTSHRFSEFYRDDFSEEDEKAFAAAKGPDFVSRLRGYVNILGPNPASEDDRFYMIRRAMLLRFMLKKNAGQIFGDSGEARIDPAVLCAMIKVPKYRHGVRSLLALIDMSRLSDRRRFEQSAFPPKEQLQLHVDAEMFTRLMLQDVLFAESLERMARAVHEKYREDMKGKRPATHPAMRPWGKLSPGMRESNRRQALQIPEKLQAIKCGMVPVVGKAHSGVELKPAEVEFLAKMEHERYLAERKAAGWTHGPDNDEKKQREALVSWEDLPESERVKDRATVRGLPQFLEKAGFEIYRLP